METLIPVILPSLLLTIVFAVTLYRLKKRIELLEVHIDISSAHLHVMNEVFQKSITIVKDALIDFDERLNMNKSVIMASVDSNRINAETRITNLEVAEKNNNAILQQEIRTTRAIVDKMGADMKLLVKIIDEINEEKNKIVLLKNRVEEYLGSWGKKLLPPGKK